MKNLNLSVLVISCGLALSAPIQAMSQEAEGWNPDLGERIFRLPPEQMEKAIQRDFNRSELAQSIREAAQQLASNQKRIEQIQGQKSSVRGEMALEVRHQEVLAKKEYLDAMSRKLTLQRRQLEIKKDFLEQAKRDLRRAEFAQNGAREMVHLRDSVKTKIDAVDIDLTAFEVAGESSPSSHHRIQYDQSLQALKTLKAAIANHQMNQSGRAMPADQRQRINFMLNDVETELAALNMQEEMLLHMVKLVSLDTMQLAQDVEVFDLESGEGSISPLDDGTMPNINLFLSKN